MQGRCLTEEQQQDIMRPITDKEIKEAMFSITNDKNDGLDGYGSYFYKSTWEITAPMHVELSKISLILENCSNR